MPLKVMVSCGESSGDLYAGALAIELRRRVPDIELLGFGGPRLRAAGARLVGDFEGLSVTGFTAPLRSVPRYLKLLGRLEAAARWFRPDVFVPVDFPDFNFLLMRRLRRLGIPVCYYVSPQLWAWRHGRMATMRAHVSRVLVIFPFETAIYERAGVPVTFVGHPLIDLSRATERREPFLRSCGLLPEAPTVALLPGSRRSELQRIVPGMARTLPLVRAKVAGVQFVVACAPDLPESLFAPLVEGQPPRPVLVRGRTDDVLAACDAALTASGTATVQCALHERPMVVVYRLSALEYWIGRRFVTVDMFAMANLIAGAPIVPELIQDAFTPERAAAEIVSYLGDRERHARTSAALRIVRERLGQPGASGRAADAVIEVARAPRVAGGRT